MPAIRVNRDNVVITIEIEASEDPPEASFYDGETNSWQEPHPGLAKQVHELEQVSVGDWAWCDVTLTARFSDLGLRIDRPPSCWFIAIRIEPERFHRSTRITLIRPRLSRGEFPGGSDTRPRRTRSNRQISTITHACQFSVLADFS